MYVTYLRKECDVLMQELTFPPNWKTRPAPIRDQSEFTISVNELNSFQRCRRQWEITSASQASLHRKGMPLPQFHQGSAVHFAMASQALGGDPLSAALIYYQHAVDELNEQWEKTIGTGLGYDELQLLGEQRDQVLGMVRAYVARYGKRNPTKPYRIVAPEVTFKIPLVPDYDIYLVGTIDRIHVDQFGNPIPGEIKTYKSKPDRKKWRFNHQLYGYAAALQVLTGKPVPFGLYDGLRKKAPLTPKILQSGEVSVAWIDTTYDIYKEVLLEVYGGDKSVLVSKRYGDLLSRLKARDLSSESAFHSRFRVPISQHAIEMWWDQAQVIGMEMAHSPIIYPHFTWQGCPDCRVTDICGAIQNGDDLGPFLDEYDYGLTHTRQASTIATPDTVKSIKDLEAFARHMDPDSPFDTGKVKENSEES